MINARKQFLPLLVPGIVLLWALSSPLTAQTTMLHSFEYPVDGGEPFGDVLVVGDTIYGMTSTGGSGYYGVIFSLLTDGTGYQIIHEFDQTEGNGSEPHGALVTDGTALYGMTYWGGLVSPSSAGLGVVFRINFDGTGYTHLHEFRGFPEGDGGHPRGSLVLDGTTLYGMTHSHGSNFDGTIFKVETDGSGYAVLHHFASAYPYYSGYYPLDSLVLDGTALYGTTSQGAGDGGGTDAGTVFSIQTDGTGYTTLCTFTGPNGSLPQGTLLLVGTTLYGTTAVGGAHSCGVVFAVETDGSGFQLLHEFNNAVEGIRPEGALTLVNGKLYGLTSVSSHIFSLNPDGSEYEVVHQFTGCDWDPLLADGWQTLGSLTAAGSTLYGMSRYGGLCSANDGMLFSLDLGAPTIAATFHCSPDSGVVPFQSAMTVELFNLYAGQARRMAARIDIDLADGLHVNSWRAGFTNIAADDFFGISWIQTIPALGSMIGANTFQLVAEDVTPAPFNQPPHPPAGQTDTAFCTIEGIAP